MVWFEMLMLMHDSERRGVLVLNGRAMGDDMVSQLLGLDNQTFNQIRTLLLDRGVASIEEETGALMNRRMVRDENLRKIRAESGSKGGNPVLLNQKPTTLDKQIPTPSAREMKTGDEEEESLKKKLSVGANGEFMAAGHILEELHVVGRDRLVTVAADAIQGLVAEGGDTQTATEYILRAGRQAIASGEVINRFWFTDQRYRPQKSKPGPPNPGSANQMVETEEESFQMYASMSAKWRQANPHKAFDERIATEANHG